MTHYEIIRVTINASQKDIRRNYRRLVKTYHPDLNSSEEAKELIVKITEAYEVLSDPYKRQVYDSLLLGHSTEPIPQQVDERELRKRAFIRKRKIQEQEYWERLFKLKVKFYKIQRYFAFVFLFVSLVYSYDYYSTDQRGKFKIEKITLDNRGRCNISFGFIGFKTDYELYDKVKKNNVTHLNIHYSKLHGIPVGLSIANTSYYHIDGTIHSFNNFFGFFLLFVSLVLIYNKRYSDWVLTLGILPFFITLFLLLMTYQSIKGIDL